VHIEAVVREEGHPTMKPNTRNWKAWLDLEPPTLSTFHVVGEVEVPATNKEAVLTKADPQGTNPSILILDLAVRDTGEAGEQAMTWREAHYQETWVKLGQYKQVDIRWEQDVIESIEVDETMI
jgi:hypothetical protein